MPAKLRLRLLPAAAASGAILNAASIAIFALVSVWWIGAVAAVLRSCAPPRGLPIFGRVVALWIALVAVTVVMPHAPVFVGRDFDLRSANLWESLRARSCSAANAGAAQGEDARFEQSQRSLLQAEVAALIPPKQGATNVYAIGIAGWAGQDVFLKELDGGLAVLERNPPDQRAYAAPGESARDPRKPAARKSNEISPLRCMLSAS